MLRRIACLNDPLETQRFLLIHAAIFLLAMAGFYAFYLYGLEGLRDAYGKPLGRDFIAYWTAIDLLREGRIEALYDQEAFGARLAEIAGGPIHLYWSYPPVMLLLLWPLTALDYVSGYAVWSALNLFSFLFALFYRSSLNRTWWLMALGAPPLLFNLFIGQNGLLCAALLIGGLRLLSSRPGMAGILFGMLCIKPHLGLLLPVVLLALRAWRAFGFAVLTVFCLAAISAQCFGLHAWAGFWHSLTAVQSQVMTLASEKMITLFAAMQTMGASQTLSYSVQTCVSLAVTSTVFIITRTSQIVSWTLLLPAIFLVTPYGFTYDLCALAGGWLLWLSQQRVLSPLQTLVWLLLWYAPVYNQSANEAGVTVVALALMAAFIAALKQSTSPLSRGAAAA